MNGYLVGVVAMKIKRCKLENVSRGDQGKIKKWNKN